MNWDIDKSKIVFDSPWFQLESLDLIDKVRGPESHPYYRIRSPDWVNILPVTSDGRALMIRQPRSGSMQMELECPGGCVEPHEKDMTQAAVRELEEETGFVSQRIIPLASISPNPALMNNRMHYFLALDVQPAMPRKHFPDASEQMKVELVDVRELDNLIRLGRINHSLCCLCIMLAQRYLTKFLENP